MVRKRKTDRQTDEDRQRKRFNSLLSVYESETLLENIKHSCNVLQNRNKSAKAFHRSKI